MMLSAQGAPEMPAGGSELSRLKSRMSRRRHAVDYITTQSVLIVVVGVESLTMLDVVSD